MLISISFFLYLTLFLLVLSYMLYVISPLLSITRSPFVIVLCLTMFLCLILSLSNLYNSSFSLHLFHSLSINFCSLSLTLSVYAFVTLTLKVSFHGLQKMTQLMRKKIRERSIFFIFIQEDGGSQEKQSIFIEDILLERDVDAKERRNVVLLRYDAWASLAFCCTRCCAATDF